MEKTQHKCASMNFFKRFWKKYGTKQARYAQLDYSCYFELPAVSGMRLESRYLGKLGLPKGYVLVCDPLLGLYDALPYTRRVPPGQYPVSLLVATGQTAKKNALLRMSFSEERPQYWELALLPGQSASPDHANDAFYGFTADAGVGCLCDAQVQPYFNQYLERFFKDYPEGDVYSSVLSAAFEKNGGLGANFYLPSSPQMNAMLFHTGYGDGIYPAYWGLGKNGDVCSFVIDFLVL